MEFDFRVLRRPGLLLVFLTLVCCTAFADGSHDQTQFGHDIMVAPGEQIGAATCFGCSVRVRGQIAGDVTTFGGNVIIEEEGTVGGDTTTFGANVRLEGASKIGGDLTVFGGRIYRDPKSAVGGDVTNFSGGVWIPVIFGLPFIILGGFIALIIWLIRRFTRPALPAAA